MAQKPRAQVWVKKTHLLCTEHRAKESAWHYTGSAPKSAKTSHFLGQQGMDRAVCRKSKGTFVLPWKWNWAWRAHGVHVQYACVRV